MIKICTDAEFLTTVEVGQYFMTKDTAEFSQFTDAVACREYTLPREEGASEPKGWIRGNTKIGARIWTLQLVACKVNMELRSEFMYLNKDNSHSWVRISHGLNKLVTNLNNEQETSEVQFEEYVLRLNAGDFASRTKAQQNHTDVLLPAHPQELYLLGKELGPMMNQENIQSRIVKCRRN